MTCPSVSRARIRAQTSMSIWEAPFEVGQRGSNLGEFLFQARALQSTSISHTVVRVGRPANESPRSGREEDRGLACFYSRRGERVSGWRTGCCMLLVTRANTDCSSELPHHMDANKFSRWSARGAGGRWLPTKVWSENLKAKQLLPFVRHPHRVEKVRYLDTPVKMLIGPLLPGSGLSMPSQGVVSSRLLKHGKVSRHRCCRCWSSLWQYPVREKLG